MKTREFDINNYKVEDIIKDEVVHSAKEYFDKFEHPLLIEKQSNFYHVQSYYSKMKAFDSMSKKEQDAIIKIAKSQYEEKKAQTVTKWKELKDKCDSIFHDDKHYSKLLPELESLYYCQAHTALYDFYNKKIGSKAVSNAKYQARAMSYSTISCD